MKILISISFLILSHFAFGNDYYVDFSGGNDGSLGTTTSVPWKTINKVNTFSYPAGTHTVHFKRGESWREDLIVSRSNISFTDYGMGPKPVITGLVTVTVWVPSGNGIWSTVIDAAQSNLNFVTINGVPQQIGRTPNADAANGGFLPFTAGVGVDKIRGAETGNLVGKKLIVKKNYWREENWVVTAHGHDTITGRPARRITDGGFSPMEAVGGGRGYFKYDDSTYLDKFGEWHFDSVSKRLRIYFGANNPSSYTVKVSTLDTLISIGGFSNINISNLALEGANLYATQGGGGDNITIDSVDVRGSGAKGFGQTASSRVLIQNSTGNYCLQNFIYVNSISGSNNNVRIINNRATNTAMIDGMFTQFHPEDGSAISASAVDTLLVYGNYVQYTGNCGYVTGGAGPLTTSYGALIEKNVGQYCGYHLGDQATFYHYELKTSPYKHKVWKDNFGFDGIGNSNGTNSTVRRFSHFYLDGQAHDDTVTNCVGANAPHRDIIVNEGLDVVIDGNTGYGTNTGILVSKLGIRAAVDTAALHIAFDTLHRDSIHVAITNNTFYNFSATNQAQFYYVDAYLKGKTVAQSLARMGTVNNNRYNLTTLTKWKAEVYSTPGVGVSYPLMNFSLWKTNSGKDASSTALDDYVIDQTLLLTNPTASDSTIYLDRVWTKVGTATTYERTITLPAWSTLLLVNPQPLTGIETNIIRGIKFTNGN